MMRRQGVIELEPGRVEIAVLAEDVVGRVGGEHERRIVAETRCVVQAPITEECAREQLRRAPAFGRALREAVAPAEVDEPVYVLLVVVDDPLDRVERDGKAGAGAVDVEIYDVAVGWDVLDLPEPEQVGTVVV